MKLPQIFKGDQLNVAGHKVPLAALGVIATIGAAVLLLRSSRNSNAAAIEQAQAGGTGVFGGASGADSSGSMAALLAQLQNLLNNAGSGSTAQPPASGPGAAGRVPKNVSSGSRTASRGSRMSSAPKPKAPIQPASKPKTFVDSPLFRKPTYRDVSGTVFPGTAQVDVATAYAGGSSSRPGSRVSSYPTATKKVTVNLNPPGGLFVPFNPTKARSTGNLALG